MKKIFWLPYVFVVILLFSCGEQKEMKLNTISIRLPMDPISLNPLSAENIYSLQVANLLFQSLLTTDLADGNLKPVLAESLPRVKRLDTSTQITYTIRKEATWDNGTPVTAKDVAFTIKLIKCPGLNNDALNADFEIVKDIILYPDSLSKFTLVYQGYIPEMVFLSGDFPILPAYLFDSAHLLENIRIPMLVNSRDSVAQLPSVKKYAQFFNTSDMTRNTKYLTGSGGYKLELWKTGQLVRLRKKANWWASQLQLSHITANPEQIDYLIIPDNNTAMMMLKGKQLDVLDNISVQEFSRNSKTPPLNADFSWLSPPTYSFIYLGINSRLNKFADQSTRQAIAHLVDISTISKLLTGGLAKPTIGPINPTSPYYNHSIKSYPFDVKKAQNLLENAGWKKNQEGEWMRNGEKLMINFQYKAGNVDYESIGHILQQDALKIGIPVEIQPVEGQKMSENLDGGDFDVFIRSMSGNPFIFNFTSIYHTGAVGENNYTRFGTVESDSIIDRINSVDNEREKTLLLKRMQEILHQESTIVFLYTTNNRMAISKRFTNPKVSAIRPNYDVSALTVIK